jgi:acetamidase/formamidase
MKGHNQFTPTSTAADVPNFNFALGDPAHGPVFIRDAKPGDVLAVEFLDLEVADYGWTGTFPLVFLLSYPSEPYIFIIHSSFLPRTAKSSKEITNGKTCNLTAIFPGSANFGLLADEFPEPELKIWDLATAKKTGFAVFKPGIEIPLRPFLGVVGVARGVGGEVSFYLTYFFQFFECSDSWTEFAVFGGDGEINGLFSAIFTTKKKKTLDIPFSIPFIFI